MPKKNLIFVSFLDKITLNYIFQSTVLHTPKIQQPRYKRKACVTITTNATLNAVLVQKKNNKPSVCHCLDKDKKAAFFGLWGVRFFPF